jgi:hypothetical protein
MMNLENDLRAAIFNSNLGMKNYAYRSNHIRPTNLGK